MRPVVTALADVAAPEAFAELCRDELSGVDVAADGWEAGAQDTPGGSRRRRTGQTPQ